MVMTAATPGTSRCGGRPTAIRSLATYVPPRVLDDAVCSGRLKKGDLALFASVGAGFTVGAVLLRWGF